MSRSSNPMYCFRASYKSVFNVDPSKNMEWLCVETNWQGYRIHTVPWVADVAKVLGLLPIEEDLPEVWIAYLESLGLKDIILVSCEEFFEDKLYY